MDQLGLSIMFVMGLLFVAPAYKQLYKRLKRASDSIS
jgi:hypothetical protein